MLRATLQKGGRVEEPLSEAQSEPVDIAIASDPGDTRDTLWIRLLERFDAVIYGAVGVVFGFSAVLSLLYGLYAVGDQVVGQIMHPAGFSLTALAEKESGAQDIIALVSNLLLTLIIMEVLGTVVHHLRERETTLKPFLFIGIISATRGILAVGARLSVTSNGAVSFDEFVRDMVELGVNGAVIIALGITMRLIGNYLDQGAVPRRVQQRAVAATPGSVPPRQPAAPVLAPAALPAARRAGRDLLIVAALLMVMVLAVMFAALLIFAGHR